MSLGFVVMLTSLAGILGTLNAQEATITINGYGWGQIKGIGHGCPMRELGNGRWRLDGYVGLQISCPVWGVDSLNAFTPASVSVVPSDSARVSAVVVHTPVDINGNFYADTLKIQILRGGNWTLGLFANPVLSIFSFGFNRPDDAHWPRVNTTEPRALVGETVALCAYAMGNWTEAVGYVPTAKSESSHECPDPWDYDEAGRDVANDRPPLPTFAVEWSFDEEYLAPAIDPGNVPASYLALLQQHPDRWGPKIVEPLKPIPIVGVTNPGSD